MAFISFSVMSTQSSSFNPATPNLLSHSVLACSASSSFRLFSKADVSGGCFCSLLLPAAAISSFTFSLTRLSRSARRALSQTSKLFHSLRNFADVIKAGDSAFCGVDFVNCDKPGPADSGGGCSGGAVVCVGGAVGFCG
jgi:hypothetical protein